MQHENAILNGSLPAKKGMSPLFGHGESPTWHLGPCVAGDGPSDELGAQGLALALRTREVSQEPYLIVLFYSILFYSII